MSDKIVNQGQSFLDKVLETTGSIENAFEMAILNGVSITDDVEIAQQVVASKVSNKAVKATFNEYNKPATAMKKPPKPPGLGTGIGYMAIGVNFKIG